MSDEAVSMRPKVSVVINTYNEEQNIRNCLECVKWADEIIVVDMHSTDRTAEIAREYTPRVLMFEHLGYCEPAREYGIESASHEWILLLDADEMVPRSLKDRLLELAATDQFDVIYVPRRTYMFGHAMRATSFGPLQDTHPRFFRKGSIVWPPVVHSVPDIPYGVRLRYIEDESCSLEHFSWHDVDAYLDRMNFYTRVEARDALDAGRKLSVPKVMLGALREFVVRYIHNRGYRDGMHGLAIAILVAGYRAQVGLKNCVMHRYGTAEPACEVLREYRERADALIAEHSEVQAASAAPKGGRA